MTSHNDKVESGTRGVDWKDSPLWDSLAQKRGIRLPMWHKAPTPRLLKRWHESLDKGAPFEVAYGCSPTRLIALNQEMPLRAFIGQMLELAELGDFPNV